LPGWSSEQEIPLGHREFGCRLFLPHVAVDPHRERVGINLDAGQCVVERHVGLADLADIADRDQPPGDREPVGQSGLEGLPTKCTDVAAAAAGAAPNIGRGNTGCGVGMEAFASPIAAQAIIPPLITACGRTPKNAGSQITRSASLPTSTEPISWSRPWAMAGQIVYLAT
jgi:hypothetical protein